MTAATWLARTAVEDLAEAEQMLARARADLRDARAALHRARAVRRHALDRAAKLNAESLLASCLDEAEALLGVLP